MRKVLAVMNVIAWSGFWAFGYLALSADIRDVAQVETALVLAALGFGLGMFSWLKLARGAG